MQIQNSIRRSRHLLALALLSAFAAPAWADSCTGTGVDSSNAVAGTNTTACGEGNTAFGNNSSAFGFLNLTAQNNSSAFGFGAAAMGANSTAFGAWDDLNGDGTLPTFFGVVLGDTDFDGDGLADFNSEITTAYGAHSLAIGAASQAIGSFSNVVGFRNAAYGEASNAFGSNNRATGIGSNALGGSNTASGDYSTAVGYNNNASASYSTALGYGAVADREFTVSVGATGAEHQIVNVAAGTQTTDAVNLGQLQSTLATANAYTDTAVATGGTQANAYTDNRETAIRGDMTAGDARTLSQANSYTDARISEISNLSDDFDAFRGDVNRRIGVQDDRIDRVGALGSAMIGMAASAAAVEGSRTRLGVAAGTYGGKQALSIGLQQRVGTRAAVTIGGAFSGSERSATVGVGFGL